MADCNQQWIDLTKEKPLDSQPCKVRFFDGQQDTGEYWADLDIFALDGNPVGRGLYVTRWMAV